MSATTSSTRSNEMAARMATRVMSRPDDFGSDDDDVIEPSSIYASRAGSHQATTTSNNDDGGLESSLLPLAASKLRFGPDAFCGRQEQLNKLAAAFRACSHAKNGRGGQVVWLRGRSGSGKTALVRHFHEKVSKACFFLSGKFDQNVSRPLVVWRQILTKLCETLKQDGVLREEVRACFVPPIKDDEDGSHDNDDAASLDWQEEFDRLSCLCPSMKSLLGDDDDDDGEEEREREVGDEDEDDRTTSSTASRLGIAPWGLDTHVAFAQALRKLLRHISEHVQQLVIFLDDVQWSDKTSLTLIQNLTCKRECTGRVMFLLAARNDEEWNPALQAISTDLETIAQARDDDGKFLNLTSIEVGNLSLENLISMVAHCLSCNHSTEVEDLARVVQRKTQGNAFFVQAFLQLLVDEERLRFNPLTFRWNWDALDIENSVQVSNNVCDMMLKQMNRNLSTTEADALFTAALLGFRFSRGLLVTALEHTTAAECLSKLLEKGLVQEVASGSYYSFTHDKIREAAKQLCPSNELLRKAHEVGIKLLGRIEREEWDQDIFTVLSLLSCDLLQEQGQPVRDKIARLNYHAGQKALGLHAFSLAQTCLRTAVDLFSEEVWTTDYTLAVDLYSSLIETQFILCDGLERLQATYTTLCLYATRDHRDRFRGTVAYLRQSHVSCAYETGRVIALEALDEYGCSLPHLFWLVRTAVGLKSVVKRLCSLSPEDIVALPDGSPADEETQHLLVGPLFHLLYQLGSKQLPLTSIRSVNITLQNGLTDFSAFGLAQVALFVLAGLGDFAKAQYIVKQVIAIMKTRQLPPRVQVSTKHLIYSHIWHWGRPLKESMVALVGNYTLGRKYGVVQYAMNSILMYLVMAFATGRPLNALSKDAWVYLRQIEDAGNTAMLGMCKALLQAVLNLMGQSEYTSNLRGDLISPADDSFLSHSNVHTFFRLHESILSVYFGDLERAYHNAKEIGDVCKLHPGIIGGKEQAFFHGLICFLKAEKSSTKKHYLKQGQKYLEKLRKWVKKGDPNLVHRLRLLEAEWAGARGRKEEAVRLYKEAIRIVARLGFNNDHALFRERFGVYLLTNDIDEGSAYDYIRNAHSLYLEWGAVAKAAKLIEDYPELPISQEQARNSRSKFHCGSSVDLV